MPTAATATGAGDERAIEAGGIGKRHRQIGAQRIERTMGKVDDAAEAKDERQSKRQEDVVGPHSARWVAARSNFLVHVNVLARLFQGKMLAMLMDAHTAGELKFFNTHAGLADKRTFKRFIAPLRRIDWVVYCKAPFAGPKQVLRYLSRYTHRVAISNRRLVAADSEAIAFRWKDYRVNGPDRWKTMRLHPHEFIRRFLRHVLPKGFHRIRHYGLFASTNRAESIATARALLNVAPPAADPQQQSNVAPDTPRVLPWPCPCCGARMIVIETFAPGCEPKWRPTPNRIDTS
jgi:hypothetical protein